MIDRRAMAVLALFLCGCPSGGGASSAPATTTASTATAKPGEVVKVGGLSLSVVGWREVAATDAVKPEAGDRFVAVDVLIVNEGAASDALADLALAVGERKYPRDIVATALIKGNPAPIVAPGDRLRTSIGFEVPKAAKDLVFVVGATATQPKADARIALGAEPAQVEAPASLGSAPSVTSQEAAADGIAVAVHGASLPTIENELVKPEPGLRYVAVDATIENRRATPAKLNLLMCARVVEPSGATHDFDSMGGALLGDERLVPSVTLEPGEKKRGKMPFQVPEKATGLVLQLDTSFPPSGPGLRVRVPEVVPAAPEAPSAFAELEKAIDADLDAIDAAGKNRDVDALVPLFRALPEKLAEWDAKTGAAGAKKRARWSKRLEEWKEVRLAVTLQTYEKDGGALVEEIRAAAAAKRADDARASLVKLEKLAERMRLEEREEFLRLADDLVKRGRGLAGPAK